MIELHQSKFLSHQWEFISDTKSKTLGLIGGLGSGKTVAFLFKTFYCHINRPGENGRSNIGIGYPTYAMGKNLFFYPFLRLLDKAEIKYKFSLSDLSISTQYGDITIKSLQHPERIIGETYTDAGIDEIDTLPKPKGVHIIRRFRERLRGRADAQLYMVSSPEGFSTAHDILVQNPNPNTSMINGKTTDNSYISQEYIDDITSSYDPQMIRAYINGEFVNLNSLQAHYAFNRDRHVQAVSIPPKGTILQVGIDFNVHPYCACVGYWEGDTLKIFKEYYLHNSNTYQMADILAADFQNDILQIYPDPTGDARKTSALTGDIEILARRGWNMKYRFGITQRHSLNITNGEFAHDRIIIDPSCKHLISDLEQVVTDSAGQIDKPKNTMLTHMSDALRNIINMNKINDQSWRVA